MNLVWNASLRRFEAEFSSDFHGDLDAVKSAKFRTTGPPQWVWFSETASKLTYLRAHKPASGLTIAQDALPIYTSMVEFETKNLEIKNKLKAARKEAKKQAAPSWLPAGKEYLTAEDLSPRPPYVSPYIRPPEPTERCVICGCGLYVPDNIEDKICLWCEKISENNT